VLYTGPSKEIDYIGAVCLVFTSKQSLSPYYWHNINDVHSPFLALIQHTNLVGTANYSGKYVYYLGTYLQNEHKYFGKDDKVIEKDFFNYLVKVFPLFDKKLVEKTWIFKFKNAQHIVTTDYHMPPNKISDKIYQANFAQIFPEDRGINFAVREGEKMAKIMESD
jgi:protoporphyrinogen oxidase